MQERPLISVIVPIYKVEPYLRQCLDSIVNQTYTNLEIILVDDGSPDGCPAICDEYAAKDNRIVVIHKENGGLSDARNAGLDICKGEWITFVDSDDWISFNFIETMLNEAQSANAKISICKYISTQSRFTFSFQNTNVFKYAFTPIEAVKKLWSNDKTTFVTAWGKLYRKTLWGNIRFPKGVIYEDEFTTHKLLYTANKILFLDIPLYSYYQRPDSIMAKIQTTSIRTLKARFDRFLYFKKSNEPEIENMLLPQLCWDFLFASTTLKDDEIIQKGFENRKDLLNSYRFCVRDLLKKSNISFFSKLLHKLLLELPFIYILYRKCSPFHIRKM